MEDFLTSYLNSLHGIPVLTHEEEYALSDRIQGGDREAIEILVKHNLRFCVFVVRKLAAWSHSRVPPEDLISFGNEGLLKAAMKWTPTNGARFATYAKKFILRSVERNLDNTETIIRIPVKCREEIRKLLYTERALTGTLNRTPTVQELATILDKPVSRINELKYYVAQEPSSLDAINQDKIEEHDDHD